jgi:hypothetical protein
MEMVGTIMSLFNRLRLFLNKRKQLAPGYVIKNARYLSVHISEATGKAQRHF